ncbi:attP region and P4int integrase [Escherichia coli]|nr:attP region and P4int integrase [Escherichia coli]
MSHTGRMPEVKNRMFTLHPLFTTYHTEIKGEKRKVNSVNSSFEKKFFSRVNVREDTCKN